MRHSFSFCILTALWIVSCAAVSVRAQVVIVPPMVTVSTGYSNLQTERSTNLFYNRSGAYIDGDVAWQLPLIIPLQAGIGVTGSGNWDRRSIDFNADSDGFYYRDHLYSDVDNFSIEPRLGLRLGRATGFFALPRIGAGLLINSYAVDRSFNDTNGNTYITTDYHTGAAFEIRPAIQVGYSWGRIAAGAEASYSYAWGDFGGLGHHAQEYRIGAFIKFGF